MNDDIGTMARGVIMSGFNGPTLDPALPHFGGYVLFERNGASVGEIRALTDALRARGNEAPLIAIDQEGGAVSRLRGGVEAMPSMMALGAIGDLELAERAGEQIAFDLRRAGCTLDFAPVLDLALDERNTVIGTRSLGSDPESVAALGAAFARGLERGGIVPCYKHFPGHGATAVDSHEALPVIDVQETTLRRRDLLPFAAVARDAPAIMGAHALVPAFDAQFPATLSGGIVNGLLRGELGFGGAYVTDCLEMKAVATRGSVECATQALGAGADLLLFSQSVDLALAAADAIARAVREERIPAQRLQEAHARVLRLRNASASPLPTGAFPPHPGVGREIGRRAVTLLRGVPRADPVTSIVVSFGDERSASLRREAPVLKEVTVSSDPSDGEVDGIFTSIAQSGRRPLLLSRRAHLHPAQARAIARIVDRYPDAPVASLLEPFDLPLFASARHLLATYGDSQASIAGLADVLFGGSLAEGHVPVKLLEPVSD
jgi:beta-N-acetylhexosaminidase